MIDKLEGIYKRWQEIGELMNNPAVTADMKKFIKLNKDYKELQPIVDAYKEYANVLANIDSARKVLKTEKDEEFRELAKHELHDLTEKRDQMEEDIRFMLIPKDPQDDKNAMIEIRAGTGGDEASIFAGDLSRMYTKFCEIKNWKIEEVSMTEGTVGGFKEIIFEISMRKQ